MTDRVSNVNAFASFTYVENDDAESAAVFKFKDDAGQTLLLRTTFKIASEMRALLNEAFTQMEQAGVGPSAGLLTPAAQHGSNLH